jgi:hypothetical protein
MRRFLATLAAVAALFAMSGAGLAEPRITTLPDGTEVTESPTGFPADFPPGFPLYPGATLVAIMRHPDRAENPGRLSALMTTTAGPDEVFRYYGRHAVAFAEWRGDGSRSLGLDKNGKVVKLIWEQKDGTYTLVALKGGRRLHELMQVCTPMEQLDPAIRPFVFLTGLLEVLRWKSVPACKAVTKAATGRARDAADYARIAGACKATCAGDPARLLTLPRDRRSAEVVASCDRRGPDLAFGAVPLAARRSSIDAIVYMMLRVLIGEARTALDRDPARATAAEVWACYERLLPSIVDALAAQERERVGPP